MCNNHPAHTSPWLILAHQCTYYNIACLPANLSEDRTAVSGFSGNTSRATHRGDFNCVVRAQSERLIHLVDSSAALVIPDSHRNLYSVRHAQHSGHTVILGAQAGLLPYGNPDLFVHSSKTNPLAYGFYHYSYHRYKNWSETLIKKYKVFKLHPMAAAHEVALVTKLISAITKVGVNPNIAHPLPFSTVIQEMDAYYEIGRASCRERV